MRLRHFIIYLLLITVIACDGELDIKPDDIIVEGDVYQSQVLADRALGDCYHLFFIASTSGLSYSLGDFSTDITECSDFNELFNSGDIPTIDARVLSLWTQYYAAINIANNLIVKIPQLASYNEEVQLRQVAEAKFIRAFSYFSLLKYFGSGALMGDMGGLGLPLQLTPFEGYTPDKLIPRSTNDAVYDQIIQDLEEAYEILPVSFATALDTRTRGTKGTVNALLSRVYLYQGNYEEAANKALLVLEETSLYNLSDDLLKVFPPNPNPNIVIPMTSEHILCFPVSGNNMGNNRLGGAYYFKRDIWINDDFLDMHEEGDLRADTLVFNGYVPNPPSSEPILLPRKTTFKFNEPTARDNVAVIRLSEIMLTRAETLARTIGINQESIDLLNQVRDRAFKVDEKPEPFELSDFPDAEDLIERILLERKFELAFEGHLRFDLIRTGKDLKYPGFSDDQKVLPIPQFEIEISEGVIQQNPGY